MRGILILLVIINWSCSTNNRYNIFDIASFKNYQLISLDTLNDIETFNSNFWSMDSMNSEMSYVVRYDFNNGEFNNNSTKGIKLEGLPYKCLIYDCIERNTLRFYLDEDYKIKDFENNLLSELQMKNLVKRNIWNYGKDPSLSDSPEDAIISIFLTPSQRIDKIDKPLQHIVDGYLEILTTKMKETGKPIEELIGEFPLSIELRKIIHDTIKIPQEIYGEIESEIQENIIIDTTLFKED